MMYGEWCKNVVAASLVILSDPHTGFTSIHNIIILMLHLSVHLSVTM